MATEFKILRGSKATLIDNDGVVLIPEEKLVNGYWYLTNDTAEVFVCLEIDGHLTLKKINECLDASGAEWDEIRIEDIENRLTVLETQASDVLTCASLEAFPVTGRPNTLYVDTATQKSYIWLNAKYVPVSSSEYVEPAVIFGGTAD